jgi:hypothetical protein
MANKQGGKRKVAGSKIAATAAELERRFDDGEDITEIAEVDPNKLVWKVNVDFPRWMVEALDAEAQRLAVPRQAVIKMWIDEKLREVASSRSA